ncbi:MAG: protein kinase [Myxococcota bacterium]
MTEDIDDPTPDQGGEVIHGRYRLDEKLGEGGYGAVYRATHLQMGSDVAVKLLHATLSATDSAAKRFALEARRSASLRHPHTISVFDFGTSERGSLYLVMEFLQGRTLSRAIAEDGPFDAERAVHILDHTLQALDAAHAQELVHRDLKPDNIYLTKVGHDDDFVKVLDFGIAKALHATGELTATGVLIGTPAFMSPEQCAGKSLDGRSDLYSLGCVAYAMLAGRAPFKSETPVGYLLAHTQDRPEDIGSFASAERPIPRELARWIHRLLEKRPEDRFATADEARSALLAAIAGSTTWEIAVPAAKRREPSRVANALATSAPTIASSALSRVPSDVTTGNVGSDVGAASPAPRSKRGLVLALVALGAAAAVAAVVIGSGGSDASGTPTAAVAKASPVAREPAPKPAPKPAAPATQAPAKPVAAAPTPAEPAAIRVRIDSIPPAAHLWLDGKDVGATPRDVSWPVGARPPEAALELAGYVRTPIALAADDDGKVRHLQLARAPVEAAPVEVAPPPASPPPTAPVEAKPVDPKPVDPKPAEAKPAAKPKRPTKPEAKPDAPPVFERVE